MKKKYSEFYFIDDEKIYPDTQYWELFDRDRKQAEIKYADKMYCPICLEAPLTVANGDKLRYFKVSKSNMHKHQKECPYLLDAATKKEIEDFYSKVAFDDIQSRLTTVMNRMLKQIFNSKNKTSKEKDSDMDNVFDSFTIKNKKSTKKYLPNISLYSKNLRNELDEIKIYYGKCKLWYKKVSSEASSENFYIYILNSKTDSLICSLKVSPEVFFYLNKNFKENLPESKDSAKLYFVCFAVNFKLNNDFLNATLFHSKMAKFEKC